MLANFQRRAAMVVLCKELARQRLVGTAVRDCFPSRVMNTDRDYVQKSMKTAGCVTKYLTAGEN
jgi:hypothetical protein